MVEPKDPSLGASGPEGDARVGRPLLIAARFRRKAKGLLFSPEHAGALLLAPCNDVHTAGMRHRLDIAFVDAQGLVLEAHRDVGRWTVRFELPGYAPVMEADGREGGVVVRFQPSDEVGGAGDGGRRVPRGTHARDAPSENRASASAAGRS